MNDLKNLSLISTSTESISIKLRHRKNSKIERNWKNQSNLIKNFADKKIKFDNILLIKSNIHGTNYYNNEIIKCKNLKSSMTNFQLLLKNTTISNDRKGWLRNPFK